METLSPKYSCSCSDKQPKLSPEGVPSLWHITFQTTASQSYNAWHTDYLQSNNYVTEDKCSRNDISTSSRELSLSHCRVNPMLSPVRKKNSTPFIVQSPSPVWLFTTPWTAARQASLSFTISWNLLKLMPIESGMPSNHLTLSCPIFLRPSIFPGIRVFSKHTGCCFWCIRGVLIS